MRHRFAILAVSLAVTLTGCKQSQPTFKPSDFGWGFTVDRLLGDTPKERHSFRQVSSDHWFTRVFDVDVATDDAPALFARWRDEIESELRSSGTKFSRNRAQLPNLELIYWPSNNLTGTLHLFLTPLPNDRARVTGLVYEYEKDG